MAESCYLRVRSLSGLMALSLVALSGNAFAQSGGERQIEELVVTAKFQRSLQEAIEQKANADTQIEAIGLEDIGVLPAKSIADAIATLPGVAGGRSDDGTISQLSVRGTTDLTLGTLNGREQVTVASTRNVEYALYPPNVMSSVQVYKTQKANLPEGGLAGVINMNTIRPLDMEERSLVFNGQVAWAEVSDALPQTDDNSFQGSILYVDQLTENFGLALSYAHASDVLGRDADVNPFDWRGFSAGFGDAAPDVDMDGEGGDEVVPAGFTMGSSGGEETRDSFFVAMQWEDDAYEVNFDLLYSEREQDFLAHFLNFIGTTGAGGSVTNATFNARDGVDEVASATITIPGTNSTGFGSGGSSQANQLSLREEEVLSTGINVKYSGEDWTATVDLSHSASEEIFDIKNTSTQLAPAGGFGGPTFTLTYNALGPNPTLSAAEDLLDPTIWVPRQYEEVTRGSEDELTALRFDFEYMLDGYGDSFGLTSIEAGARYSEREKVFDVTNNRFTLTVEPDIDPASMTILPLDGSFAYGQFNPRNGPSFLLWDPIAIRDARFTDQNPQVDTTNPILTQNTLLQESGSVEEDTLSLYVQLNFEGEMGVPYTGNFGLRHVDTDSLSPGWTTPDRTTVAATTIVPGHDYSEVLPSLNLSFELTDEQKLRFGYAKVLNRAPLDDLKSSQTIFISGFGANGNSGNPTLDPTVADQYSLSYEWYPSDSSSFVIAAHYSDLDTFIGTEFTTIQVVPFGGGEPVDVELQTVGNGDGGYIRGYELAATTDLSFIDESLAGFGFSANYAFTESDVVPVGAPALGGSTGSQGAALTGLSEDVANVAVWWAGGNIEARIGWDYRSEYIEPTVFGNFQHVDETTLMSLNLSYDFSEDFRVSLFGSNIGDEQRRKYTGGVPDRTEFNAYYGEIYGLSVFYKM